MIDVFSDILAALCVAGVFSLILYLSSQLSKYRAKEYRESLISEILIRIKEQDETNPSKND